MPEKDYMDSQVLYGHNYLRKLKVVALFHFALIILANIRYSKLNVILFLLDLWLLE